jgi:ATP-dependent Lon protease
VFALSLRQHANASPSAWPLTFSLRVTRRDSLLPTPRLPTALIPAMSLLGSLRPAATLKRPVTWAAAHHAGNASATTRACWQLARPGPSRIGLGGTDERARTFQSSGPYKVARTAQRMYPRWVNTKPSHRNAEEAAQTGAEGQEGKDEKGVRADDQDDGAARSGAPSDSSNPPASSSSGGDGSDSSPPSGSDSGSGSNSSSNPPPPPSPSSTSIQKQSVPEHYPQLLALPIARRPLFPGFYKAVVVRNPAVVSAIKEMMKRGQPYLGAFLLKDENSDSDIISDPDAVHPVGVFAQITSVFAANTPAGADGEKEEGLTAVLYPHRRIRITELLKRGEDQPAVAKVEEAAADALPTPPETPPETPVAEESRELEPAIKSPG